MNISNSNSRGMQDYDVPPSDRDFIDVRSTARRPSYDALRISTGSRKGSLVPDLYDTPPSSKRGSAENANEIYDTPPSSKRASSERTPPHSNRSSASRDSGSNPQSTNSPSQLCLQQNGISLNMPSNLHRRSGSNSSDNCYETPPGSNRSSLERILSEEGPPIYESLSPATSMEHLNASDPIYDIPPSRNHPKSLTSTTYQSSLCSAASKESLMSNTSSLSSTHISQTTSLSDSARSSMDLPSDIYDVPPSAQESQTSRKQLSVDSGLGFYDSPLKSRPSSSTSNNEFLRSSQSSFACKPSVIDKDIKRSKSLENSVDGFYDTPKNNVPKINLKTLGETGDHNSMYASNESSDVYDIPPQVTRDSVISMTSNSSDENMRLSSSSLDIEQQLAGVLLWDELLLDLNSAMELMQQKQQDVSKAASRLSSYVNSTWRSRSSLEKTLYDIKVSCTLVRNSLHDFIEFSHGAVANAVKIPDYHLANVLQKYVSPLQSTLELVNRSFLKLEEIKWQVSLLSEPLGKSEPDDLSQIALVSKDLMLDINKVASFIQSNGHLLFKKAAVVENKKSLVSSKPPLVPKLVENNKGHVIGSTQTKHMQHRPLPAVPSNEKFLPKTNMPSLVDAPKLSVYDIKAAIHKDDYAECDELPSKEDTEQVQKTGMEQGKQEYDYVQLDQRGINTKFHGKSIKPELDSSKLCGQNQSESIHNNNENKFNDSNEKDLKLKAPQTYDSPKDTIPIKDTASNNRVNLANSKSAKQFSVPNEWETTTSSSDDSSNQDLSEEDLKTPVNMNTSSGSSDFILPSPESANVAYEPESLDPNDRQVLVYYTDQMNSHSTLLANAVDAFIGVVNNKDPPNVFISHSKFVMVSAHKLVHIGDSIHRNLISNNVSMRIMQCANHLCDCLKSSVTATKTAALQYPSAPAVQEMVDRVVAVSHAAHQLKLVITQAAKQ